MSIGGLFSGVGGLELGLQRALGWPVAFHAEKKPFCRGILAGHWPDARSYDDVDDIPGDYVELLCGGFPCQPFSTASRGRRVAPDLWPAFRRCVARVLPRWVVAENVSAKPIAAAARDLAVLGYTARTLEVPASLVGAPHDRPRWFVVAYAHRQGEPRRPIDAKVAGVPHLPGVVWADEPEALGVDDGLPGRMDRLEALGNAVSPQVAEVVGWMIADLLEST